MNTKNNFRRVDSSPAVGGRIESSTKSIFLSEKFLMRAAAIIIMLLISFSVSKAAVRTSISSGNWNTSATWDCGCVPSSTDSVIISTGNTVTLAANVTVADVTINSGATLDLLANNYTLTLSGNWTDNGGTFISGNGTVAFNGSGTQTISSSSVPSFYNLTLQKAVGSKVQLATNITVSNTLTMDKCQLVLGSYNLTLEANATLSSGTNTFYASNMIVADGSGELRKYFSGVGSFTFPVGDLTGSQGYSPVTLNFTSGTFSSGYVGVRVVNSKHPNNSSPSDYLIRYWVIGSSGITSFSCDVTLKYLAADIVGTNSNITAARWDGTEWSLMDPANTVTNELTGTTSSFGEFTGGEATSLPVELISFTANVKQNNAVELNWKTASEINNKGFEVERSSDGDLFKTLGFVLPNNNNTGVHEYTWIDDSEKSLTRYYYRLKQIDFSGTIRYFNIIEVALSSDSEFEVSQSFPNPARVQTNILVNLPESNLVAIEMYNIIGQKVYEYKEKLQGGKNFLTIDVSKFSPGLYVYTVSAKGKSVTRKLNVM